MKKNFTYALATLFLSLPSMQTEAKGVDESQALRVAMTFMSTQSALRSGHSLELVYTGTGEQSGLRSSRPLYYVYNVSNAPGFILVAADDVAHPVLGYSYDSSFSADTMPPNLRGWLGRYERQIQQAIADNMEASAEITKEWTQALSTPSMPQEVVLKTALWTQGSPYNDDCPIITDYGTGKKVHAASGCVATAMGIIMKYNEWPLASVGGEVSYLSQQEDSIVNNTIINNTQTVSANLNHTYDWAQMRDTYEKGEYTEAEGKAVADLLFHVGVALKMQYDNESGAKDVNAINALQQNFNYPTAKYISRNSVSNDEFINILIKEIDSNRPMIYTSEGQNDDGHAFICDGYNSNELFHFNWGWGGSANAFYELDALRPTDVGIGADGSPDYSTDVTIIYNLEKASKETSISDFFIYYASDEDEDDEDDEDDLIPGLTQSDSSSIEKDTPFHVNIGYCAPMFLNGSKQILIGVAHKDKAGNIKEIVGKIQQEVKYSINEIEYEIDTDVALSDIPNAEDLQCLITQPIEKDDKLIGVVSQDNGKTWNPIYPKDYGTIQTEIELMSDATTSTIKPSADNELNKVYVADGKLHIETSQPQAVNIYHVSGSLVKQINVSGASNISLPQGIYLVKLTDKTYKVAL